MKYDKKTYIFGAIIMVAPIIIIAFVLKKIFDAIALHVSIDWLFRLVVSIGLSVNICLTALKWIVKDKKEDKR